MILKTCKKSSSGERYGLWVSCLWIPHFFCKFQENIKTAEEILQALIDIDFSKYKDSKKLEDLVESAKDLVDNLMDRLRWKLVNVLVLFIVLAQTGT